MTPSLAEILARLDRVTFAKIARLYRFHFDPKKRIEREEQLARWIAVHPRFRARASLTEDERALLDAVARRGGWLSAPPGTRSGTLEARALLLPFGEHHVIPRSLYLELEPWEGEPANTVRRVVLRMGDTRLRQWLTRKKGAPAASPMLLRIEAAFAEFATIEGWRKSIAQLSPMERSLFDRVRTLGGCASVGEIDGDSKDAPSSMTSATIISLQGRGLLFQDEEGELAIPVEVLAAIQEEEAAAAESEEEAPLRATYAEPPEVAAFLIATLGRQDGLREGVGIPRSFIARTSRMLGTSEERVHLLAVIVRALGLFKMRELADVEGTVATLRERLFRSLMESGAWDEALIVSDVARAKASARTIRTPTYLARDLLLEVLRKEPRAWKGREDIHASVRKDARYPILESRFRSFRAKHTESRSTEETIDTVLVQSLPALGMVDHAHGDMYRLSRWGSQVLLSHHAAQSGDPSHFEKTTLCVKGETSLQSLLELSLFGTPGTLQGELVIRLTPESITQALVRGLALERLERAISRVSKTSSPEVDELIAMFRTPVGRISVTSSSAFLFTGRGPERQALLRLPNAASLFASNSPDDGLIVKNGVAPSVLEAALRAARVTAEPTGEGT